MEKRNQKLTIIVGVLLLVIGVSFSYFLATTLIKGNGASTVGTTARINGATLNVEGTLEFDDTGILPGHKNVSAIKLTASGNNELIAYNLIWKGETGISQINYTVYKSSTPKTISTNCSNKTSVANGMQVLSEECSINNIDTLGEAIANGSINKGDTKVILAKDEFITATSDGQTVYYYVVLEYPNLDIDQSSDVESTFEGEVTVEESDKKADINILAVYVADDSGNYSETADIPQSGYQLNIEKSTCSNGAYPTGIVPNITVNNLSKSGTSCYLYFDKYTPAEDTLSNLGITNPKEPTENMFASTAITDEGVFKVADPTYGGTSYYYRGAVTNNYIQFAGFCWRIIRINGDGSIRMIYDGTTCHVNGTSTEESIVAKSQYNINSNASYYVGYTYEEELQRPSNNSTANASNLKAQIDSWYNEYLASYDNQIAAGKFCNDRNVQNGFTWSASGDTLYYAARGRLESAKTPTLDCNHGDVYTLKAGAITADEVSFAGGVWGTANNKYYLYNGQYCWTMSPYYWDGSWACAVASYTDGKLGFSNVYNMGTSPGVRPVINLRSDITFSSGNGSLEQPFVVAD